MSFMFKPYPYDDTTALNHPKVADPFSRPWRPATTPWPRR
jgi:hypothetical protein